MDTFSCRGTLKVGNRTFQIVRLDALEKRGWKIEGSDKVGDEQGLFCVQGERTLSIFFRENGPELRIQMAHVPKTPRTSPPATK